MKEWVVNLYSQLLITLNPYVIEFDTKRTIQSVNVFFIITIDVRWLMVLLCGIINWIY